MEKRKCFAFLFCLILSYSLFQYAAGAQSSPCSISTQGSITYSPLNENLAVVPDDWGYTQYPNIHLDYAVERTSGKPSIRLEPHTSADTNYACECDGAWYKCKPGDHIVAKIWIKTSAGTPAERAGIYDGARLGIDWYAPDSNNPSHICIVGPEVTAAEHEAMIVRFGTSTWTLRTWDLIVPDTYYTKDLGTGNAINPEQVTSFVLWMQLCHRSGSTAPTTEAWFADAELYIIQHE